MGLSKQAKARQFSKDAKESIRWRDGCRCIFCMNRYHMEDVRYPESQMLQYMHFIPRSQGGLGIPQNGALGCAAHHHMLDNGNQGRRKEMLDIFRRYLKCCYPGWDEKHLTYSKWR